ncbi:phosphotransferase family protein [Glycomyces niveus]|uniref:Aminoglycoside phosphotransferase family protein n=1 Tax=Glycomyces niveus TaxID=2820287 RepID=A0ABS3U999_9ACTN|nr:aminoglycoside phosphotransferase family protein [Glycomyces sp. NEAU-S30]MBO3735011.1 aminoglycoside phosphotransferase family protein [Glycomyces sp. NEAU-S30]
MIAETVGSLLGKTATAWRTPEFGLSGADRLVVTFRDGSAAFVKGATSEETAGWLPNEHRILGLLRGTGLSPEALGRQDDGTGHPLPVMEDLSDAYWPAAGVRHPSGGTSTLWRPGDIDVLRGTLDRLRRVPVPADLPRTPSRPGPQWPRVIELADRLVDAGVVIRGWLEANAETLTAVDAAADTALEPGTRLVHGDFRSDNVCIVGSVGERECRVVDWSHAGTGHELHDLVQLLPTLHLEAVRRHGRCASNPHPSSRGLPGRRCSAPVRSSSPIGSAACSSTSRRST